MTLKQWELNSWLKKHSTNRKEIENLFKLVERDINSAKENTHPDWIFNIAYNAALKLCTIPLYSSGYMAERKSNHYYTILSITEILGPNKKKKPLTLIHVELNVTPHLMIMRDLFQRKKLMNYLILY